jgi:integrase
MPLTVRRRRDTGTLAISGVLALPDGSRVRVRRRAQSDDPQLAREEAATYEAQLLRDAWLGRRPVRATFGEAVKSYLLAEDRNPGTKARLRRLLLAIGDIELARLDLAAIDRAKLAMFPGRTPAPATVLRDMLAPLRAVLNHAARRGWCEAPRFELPKVRTGRTRYLTPEEAEQLVAAAAPHLRPLLLFLIGTGARLSEALGLDWRHVDLAGGNGAGRAIFWDTKGGGRRVAALPPRIVAELAGLGHREGAVFGWRPRGAGRGPLVAYADKERQAGGQIKTAWRGALRRSGLDASQPGLTPHDLRHTYASWHYARHRDLLRLKAEGGWSSTALVERYAHLMPAGLAGEIERFLGELGPQPLTASGGAPP